MHLQNLNSKRSMHKRLYKPLHRAVHSRQLPGHIEEEICKGLLIVRLHPEQADAERQHAKHKHTDEAYVNVDDRESALWHESDMQILINHRERVPDTGKTETEPVQ